MRGVKDLEDLITTENKDAILYCIRIFKQQKRRCECKYDRAYVTQGAKGIKVLYSRRDFVKWWLKNATVKNGRLIRINSNKNYSFDNIKFIYRENALPRMNEYTNGLGQTRYKTGIYD